MQIRHKLQDAVLANHTINFKDEIIDEEPFEVPQMDSKADNYIFDEISKTKEQAVRESLGRIKPFWFVSHLGFEEYESRENRLILSLRKWSLDDPKTITVYVRHPVKVATPVFYSYEQFVSVLKRVHKDENVAKYKITAYISLRFRDKKKELEVNFPNISFQVEDSHLFVLNAEVPCDKKILNKLKKYGFQIKNLNKVIRRELEWMYREVTINESLEYLFSRFETLGQLYEKASDIVSSFYSCENYDPSMAAKKTRAFNQIRKFYREKYSMSAFNDPSQFKFVSKKFPIVYKMFLKDSEKFKRIEENMKKLSSLFFSLREIVKQLDSKNSLRYNDDTKAYEIVLESKSSSNPFEHGKTEPNGLIVHKNRISYECWKSLSTCFLDIEKPMWKTEEERKILSQISELQAELINPNSKLDPLETKEKISELTSKILFKSKQSGDVDLSQDRYKEQISRVMMHITREDGSEVRLYFKLNNPSTANSREHEKNLNGFIVLHYDNEYELIGSVLNFLKHEQPYRIVGHVIPYDLSNIRDGARENRTTSFDLAVKKKEPRIWRRGFYQKISMVAQEVIDTYRLGAVWFPYLKTNAFGMTHKLADVSNFIYREKRRMGFPTILSGEFHKIATHDELKELEIKAINGDAVAEQTLDRYSICDIDPLREMFLFEPLLKTIYSAAGMVPHIPITDVAFSPNSITEIFHIREWQSRHAQLNYGYKEKMREDERQIFKKRLDTYMKRQLEDEGIIQLPSKGVFRNVRIAYIPLELLVSGTFFPNTPQWHDYFSKLHKDPVVRFAQLQYPKYFMRRHIHVDYYLYRREKDVLQEFMHQINMSMSEMLMLFQRYYITVFKSNGAYNASLNSEFDSMENKLLTLKYKHAYLMLKDSFRSFYTTLKVKDKSSSRKIKAFIRSEPTRREDSQLIFSFVDLFSKENSDLISLNEMPDMYVDLLEEDSKKKLDRFRAQFIKFREIEKSIIDILSKDENRSLTEKISAENLIFAFNQFSLATHRSRVFNAVYHIAPEGVASFREFLNMAYKTIGDWIRANGVTVIGAKGDYIYFQEKEGQVIDFANAPLIPIGKFEKLELPSEPNYFEIDEVVDDRSFD